MNKDKEFELKVQMFCTALHVSDKNSFLLMKRVAEEVNEAFEVLKQHSEES